MTIIKRLIGSLALFAICLNSFSQGYHVRIGIIGNSITEGTFLPNPAAQCYAAQLQPLLEEIYGDTCTVENYGLTTTTMLKKGDVPYWNTKHFRECTNHSPEVCMIMLGTNDTKPQNWDVHGDEFLADYLSMIDTLKYFNPSTKFIVCYPPPAFEVKWGIRDSILVHGVIPAVDSVVAKTGAELIDFYNPLLDSVHLFPDMIHPNVDGAGVMAGIIRDRIVEMDIVHQADTGLTFVTSFSTAKLLIAIHDSVELKWTTINADTVYLNGQKVSASGSLKVSPPETTVYTIFAEGEKSVDSLKITQEVYIPELSKLSIYPAVRTPYPQDTVNYLVYYKDQNNRTMTGTYYDVQWDLVEGEGTLFDETDTSVNYIAGSQGTAKLVVTFGDLSDTSRITIRPSLLLDNKEDQKDVMLFPNPTTDRVNLSFEIIAESEVSFKIIDMKGVIQKQETFIAAGEGRKSISINTGDLAEGYYLIQLEYSDRLFTEELLIKRN